MEKIKRFFECLIPITACNIKCSYCYVVQRSNRKMKMAELKYSPEEIGNALTRERLGGTCYFSICGAGETTLQKGIEDIVFNILKQGHYVNVTTNGTITKQLEKIINISREYINHLHFSFSLHYLELKQKGLKDIFFENINMVRRAGASYIVQLNLCDEYIPFLEEIREECISKTGAGPQLAATRDEGEELKKIRLLTALSDNEYMELGKNFDSPLFDFTMKNFNVRRKEFCYAGDWSGVLDLSTGILRRCYSSYIYQNIFANPKEKIRFLAIGRHCNSAFCMNSSHFMSLGIIPELDTPTYAELRNRKEANWYSTEMEKFLSGKLIERNKPYGILKKAVVMVVGLGDFWLGSIYRFYKRHIK